MFKRFYIWFKVELNLMVINFNNFLKRRTYKIHIDTCYSREIISQFPWNQEILLQEDFESQTFINCSKKNRHQSCYCSSKVTLYVIRDFSSMKLLWNFTLLTFLLGEWQNRSMFLLKEYLRDAYNGNCLITCIYLWRW